MITCYQDRCEVVCDECESKEVGPVSMVSVFRYFLIRRGWMFWKKEGSKEYTSTCPDCTKKRPHLVNAVGNFIACDRCKVEHRTLNEKPSDEFISVEEFLANMRKKGWQTDIGLHLYDDLCPECWKWFRDNLRSMTSLIQFSWEMERI